ncbi:unnamed protein product [Enterobius vermicularis]|uniref:Carbonic anhydrase n=1 Tax=Enterobius vermicularis TaxID=51028 RepID=A0A0N4V7Y9_ENTVE|nr:unnamed protein product [Enterobius vermicularis]
MSATWFQRLSDRRLLQSSKHLVSTSSKPLYFKELQKRSCYPYFFLVVSSRFFGYTETDGPHTWNGSCRVGKRQSPVDIKSSEVVYDETIPRLQFVNYDQSSGSFFVENNGITCKIFLGFWLRKKSWKIKMACFPVVFHGFANWGANQPYIRGGTLQGEYALETMHIHWGIKNETGSEHTLGGLHYPAELHFVHKKRGHTDGVPLKGDSLAVVAAFMLIDSEGKSFAPFEAAIKDVLHNPGRSSKQKQAYSLTDLLPGSVETFYTYEGSLTTPNCEEVVIWIVLGDPITVTAEQMDLIRETKMSGDLSTGSNSRPTQPLLGRKVRFRPTARLSNMGLSPRNSINLITVLLFYNIALILH